LFGHGDTEGTEEGGIKQGRKKAHRRGSRRAAEGTERAGKNRGWRKVDGLMLADIGGKPQASKA